MKLYRTRTQEEYDWLMQKLEDEGYRWISNHKPTERNYWKGSRSETVIKIREHDKEITRAPQKAADALYVNEVSSLMTDMPADKIQDQNISITRQTPDEGKFKLESDKALVDVCVKYLEEKGCSVVNKPVIPKFVADWIEGQKNAGLEFLRAYEMLYNQVQNREANEEIVDYIQYNEHDFIHAWEDYEIEEEPLYTMKVPYQDLEIYYCIKQNGEVSSAHTSIKEPYKFTAEEIDEYFPAIMHLAKRVGDESNDSSDN